MPVQGSRCAAGLQFGRAHPARAGRGSSDGKRRIGREGGERQLLDLYAGMGRALARFRGWRATCFVANPRFVEAFGHYPTMTKPASNADLSGAFLVYEL